MAKRRPSGDGMVRKRENGRWEGRIVVGHRQNGEPIFRYVYARTQKELLDKLHREMEVYQDAELTEDSLLTLGEWLDRWLEEYMAGAVRYNTLQCYRSLIEQHIKPCLGEKRVSAVTAEDVQKMYRNLKAHGRKAEHAELGRTLSDATVRRIHGVLHLAMEAAVREHLTVRNPTEGAAIPKRSVPPKTIFTEEELDRYLEAIRADADWYDFFYTEITTGLRRGEICALRWSDFDAKEGVLKVQRTLHREAGRLVTGATKTGKGTRTIYLPEGTAELLRRRKKHSLSEWIFPNLTSPEQPVSPDTAYQRLKTILKQAGLPDIPFHALRHTFSSYALNSGVDAKTLSNILGHTNASFTLDTYTHVTGEMQRHAAEIVGDFMEDIFGKELQPWQRDAKTVTAPSI